MNAICAALAFLFAWCVIAAGHAQYQFSSVPAAITTTQPQHPNQQQGERP